MPLYTLTGQTNISLIFMLLPDGNVDGSGFASTGNVSLQDLWTGTISTIKAIDGSSSYTKSSLISTLTSLMTAFQPGQISTQDYVGTYGDGDHSDHHSVAYLTQAAQQQYNTSHAFTGYQDYPDYCPSRQCLRCRPDGEAKRFLPVCRVRLQDLLLQYRRRAAPEPITHPGCNVSTRYRQAYAPVANAGANQTVGVGSTVTAGRLR